MLAHSCSGWAEFGLRSVCKCRRLGGRHPVQRSFHNFTIPNKLEETTDHPVVFFPIFACIRPLIYWAPTLQNTMTYQDNGRGVFNQTQARYGVRYPLSKTEEHRALYLTCIIQQLTPCNGVLAAVSIFGSVDGHAQESGHL